MCKPKTKPAPPAPAGETVLELRDKYPGLVPYAPVTCGCEHVEVISYPWRDDNGRARINVREPGDCSTLRTVDADTVFVGAIPFCEPGEVRMSLTIDAKSVARRKRLQAAINRLAMNRASTAQSTRGKCSFCDCEIVTGQQYKASGEQLRAHTSCIDAVSAMLREKAGAAR